MKRLGIFVLIALVYSLVNSCSQADEPCPDNVGDFVPDANNIVGIDRFYVSDRRTQGTVVNESTPVNLEDLEIVVVFSIQEVFDNQSASWNMSGLFIKSAHACSPGPGPMSSRVVGMQLISDGALGSDLGPGSELNSLFYAEVQSANGFFSNNIETESRLLNRFSQIDPGIPSSSYVLKPSSSSTVEGLAPSNTGLHRFTFTIELATGQQFTANSSPVLIQSSP